MKVIFKNTGYHNHDMYICLGDVKIQLNDYDNTTINLEQFINSIIGDIHFLKNEIDRLSNNENIKKYGED